MRPRCDKPTADGRPCVRPLDHVGACSPTSLRGFSGMSPERLREIGRIGAAASQASGRAHRFTSEEAAAAGRIGGKVSQSRRRGAP